MAEINPNNLPTAQMLTIYYDDVTKKYYTRTTSSGTFVFSGLKLAGLITPVEINDSTWTKLPTTPMAGRMAMNIQNRSGVEIAINYNNSATYADSWAVDNRGERYFVMDGTFEDIYAMSSSGTVIIKVEEMK